MNNLTRRAFSGLIIFQVLLALMLFLPAWSLRFWEGWVYWLLFGGSCLLTTLYFLNHDPGLVASRLAVGPTAEKEKSEKVIQTLASALVCALFIVPGFDYRLHWSIVALPLVAIGNALVLLAFYVFFRVFRENRFASSIVEVQNEQQVISTGPYALVRHPMYAGALVLFLATPFALGSLWALIVGGLLIGVLVLRLLDEERYLAKNLPGYERYRHKVPYRLIPFIW